MNFVTGGSSVTQEINMIQHQVRMGVRCMSWILAMLIASTGLAQSSGFEGYVQAPPNHAILEDTLNGWIFVPMELKKQYDTALNELDSLQTDINNGRISAQQATGKLNELKVRLADLRKKLEASRVDVAGAEIHEQTESLEFSMGPERRLAITANQVNVIGWKNPHVKVDLKKSVLTNDGQLPDSILKEIRVVHEHARAKFAGQTDAEWDAQEKEFLEKQGSSLTPEQLEGRRKLVSEIRESYAPHRELIGKEIDQISITGLDYQNNGWLTQKVKSDGGDGRYGSVRQRYAEVTVYVPDCVSVCVRGARRGLIVRDLTANKLTVVSEGSTDSDNGHFEIEGLTGDLDCRNFPLQHIANVEGHVSIESTEEFANGDSGYSGGQRLFAPGRMFAVQVFNVSDGIDLHFGRVKLDVAGVGGTVNIQNDFGETFIDARTLTLQPHRIVHQAGGIVVHLSTDVLNTVPILAVTNHGEVRTDFPREVLDDFRLIGPDKLNGVRRTWVGIRTDSKDQSAEPAHGLFSLLDRFPAIQSNDTRPPGLDVLSYGGSLTLLKSE
ncbi:MAG: hypothetical protein KDB03_28065 [Planctomycetales bacterium]|nr:hypothetical protein [Planctomycetales bacterium]